MEESPHFVPASKLEIPKEYPDKYESSPKAKVPTQKGPVPGRSSPFDPPPAKRVKQSEEGSAAAEVISIEDDIDDDVEHSKSPTKIWNWRKPNKASQPVNSSIPVSKPSEASPLANQSATLFRTAPLMKQGSTPKQTALVLADRMRPNTLDEYVGHEDLVKSGSLLRKLIDNDTLPSCIFWGPPGTGKTSLANVIAHSTHCHFVKMSAVSAGVSQVKEAIADAIERKKYRQHTVLFIDEIHRFNKLQQDALLPHVENGTVTLIGATTENPSFECNAALLSRCRVFVLHKLTVEQLLPMLRRACRELGTIYPDRVSSGSNSLEVEDEILHDIAGMADGDARQALNALEMAFLAAAPRSILLDDVKFAFQRSHVLYDKTGEEHYNIISALHKSMRGSDVQAALYWMARMLEGGEDPKYVARRLIRFASEDIGLADPQALVQAVAGFKAVECIGMPECNVILAQVTAYLARAPKSNALYTAYGAIQQVIKTQPNFPVPLHLRNAPTNLMKDLGYSKGYKYNPDHDYEGDIQDYLPTELIGSKWLQYPSDKSPAE